MEVTIVEPSLYEIVSKAINLSEGGYTLASVMQIGWIYELKMEKDENVIATSPVYDKMAKARAARGVSK